MIIRPQGGTNQQIPYAAGRFGERDAFLINQIGAASPFGSLLCSLGSDYALEVLPDGGGCSWYAGTALTPAARLGKAWYIRDKESGAVWSAFFSPVGERSDEYEVAYRPGQATAFTLKNKIASELTIASIPNFPCEVWNVRLENRSAATRVLEFTTYVEPATDSGMEALFRDKERALVMRRALSAGDSIDSQGPLDGLVLFHGSTLMPTRFAVEKTDFIGDGRTLQNPIFLENEDICGDSGSVRNPIASFTIEIELPIEGEAQFGFCFGVAPNPEVAIRAAHALSSHEAVQTAVAGSLTRWDELCGGLRVETSDHVCDALINTWLPYETYSGWIRERNAPTYLDPSKVADVLRCLYPLSTIAHDAVRESLLSFAAGLSLLGSYSPDKQSLVSLPSTELLWLPIATARYVAETGDRAVLAESIALRDGPAMPLKEHCERIIKMGLNATESNRNPGDDRLLAQTIRLWSLVCGESLFRDFGSPQQPGTAPASHRSGKTGAPHSPDPETSVDLCMEAESRRRTDRPEHAEQRSLPRRVRYLQSITPTLSDKTLLSDLRDYLGSDEMGTGDVDATCSLYSALVEWTLGLNSTLEGLTLNPKLPDSWFECEITRRFRGDTYNISIRRNAGSPIGGASIIVDGEPVLGSMLPLFGDGKPHRVEVTVS